MTTILVSHALLIVVQDSTKNDSKKYRTNNKLGYAHNRNIYVVLSVNEVGYLICVRDEIEVLDFFPSLLGTNLGRLTRDEMGR
jgi:hypothetical protein